MGRSEVCVWRAVSRVARDGSKDRALICDSVAAARQLLLAALASQISGESVSPRAASPSQPRDDRAATADFRADS